MAVADMSDPAVAATWAAWGKNVIVQRMAVVSLCSLGFLATLSNSMLVYKVFRSKPLDTGEAFSYTFKDAGTFEYYCSMHPRMTGKIVVK